ncbi:MAG: hypothetical protein KJO93_04615 [Muriicola sp.]|nr:hypothetical protein [Muriicola sp.]NNK35286.1 hypothetical protein [Eudoraea sp.]
MKAAAHFFLFTIICLIAIPAQAQISNTPIRRPNINTGVSSPVALPDSYDEIIRDLNNGKCYSIALNSLQLNPTSSAKTNHNAELRYGIGAIKKDGNNLIATINIEAGVNENGSRRVLRTTVKLRKSRSGITLDIRNGQYYHLIHQLQLVKKKNGYYLSAERDEASSTVSFTLAIFRTTCLI